MIRSRLTRRQNNSELMKNIEEDIKSGKFKSIYLFYGEEAYLKNLYKNRLKNALVSSEDTMNLNVYQGKGISIPQVIDQAETMPFFADHRLILLEDSGFFKNAAPELADYLGEGAPAETVFLFVETEVDKRGKLYKTVKSKGRIVEFARQNEQTLTNWVLRALQKENLKITRSAMQLFLERTGNDMENISRELEKLISYVYGREGITREDVEAICTLRTENKIFDMINAIAEKKQKRALELYYDLLALKEAPLRILALIARQFHLLLQVKDLRRQGFDQGEIASRAGIMNFVVRNCLRQGEYFSSELLRGAVEECVRTEEAIKTGRLGDRLGVELLIVKYSQEKK
mgnify:CR=1 FL=1